MNKSVSQSSNDTQPQDFDPVVDALLAEFIPSDEARRKTPPDLSAEILLKLKRGASTQLHRPAVSASTSRRRRSSRAAKLVSVLVAVAAAFAGMVWLGGIPDQNGTTQASRDTPSDGLGGGDDTSLADRSDSATDYLIDEADAFANEDRVMTERPRGIRLATDSAEQSEPLPNSVAPAVAPKVKVPSEVPSIESFVKTTSKTAEEYWKSLELQPTPTARNEQVASRLKQRLGITLTSEMISNPQQLRDALAQPVYASEIAKQFMVAGLGGRASSVQSPQGEGLVRELSRSVSGQKDFDETLVSLIDGTSQHSSQWYESLSAGGSEQLAGRLASLTMNTDLRCVRCHDSMVGRSGTQDDHWSFVALLETHVRRDGARWTVSEDELEDVQTFYELPDGRQRLATPGIASSFFKVDDEYDSESGPLDDLGIWARSLRGSRKLADGLVETLWTMVHGRKLLPSPVDPFAPPRDESLSKLHRQLAEDLRASGFDVARTLAAIISSPMARRTVPEALRGRSSIAANRETRRQAIELAGAYAAAFSPLQSTRRQRLDIALRRLGGRLGDRPPATILAQPLTSANSMSPSRMIQQPLTFEERLESDFPTDEADLPVSWLQSIDSFEDQVDHLVYMTSGSRVTEDVRELAESLRQAGSQEAALHRLWWILRN
ncbi:MAG: hypothetical protein AAF802_23840 [Planctomycetota bacterium]